MQKMLETEEFAGSEGFSEVHRKFNCLGQTREELKIKHHKTIQQSWIIQVRHGIKIQGYVNI